MRFSHLRPNITVPSGSTSMNTEACAFHTVYPLSHSMFMIENEGAVDANNMSIQRCLPLNGTKSVYDFIPDSKYNLYQDITSFAKEIKSDGKVIEL